MRYILEVEHSLFLPEQKNLLPFFEKYGISRSSSRWKILASAKYLQKFAFCLENAAKNNQKLLCKAVELKIHSLVVLQSSIVPQNFGSKFVNFGGTTGQYNNIRERNKAVSLPTNHTHLWYLIVLTPYRTPLHHCVKLPFNLQLLLVFLFSSVMLEKRQENVVQCNPGGQTLMISLCLIPELV